jgi:glutamine amidotransferase
MLNIGIVDYGAGNLQSVRNAVKALGFSYQLIQGPDQLPEADILVLPGVGSFGDSVPALQNAGLFEPIRTWLAEKKPYLGICLGYQLLFDESEESPGVPGFGHFKGKVTRFRDPEVKIPQMGWNSLEFTHPSDPMWQGLSEEPYVYFVHSFFPQPEDPTVIATQTTYGSTTFASSARTEHLLAMQFHPEKSQATGLRLMENFLRSYS